MQEPTLEHSFDTLFEWCRRRDFAGYDPFDALNSRLFQSTPLRHSRTARLLWTQFHKRSPLNLRRLALVPPQRNAKGMALFALAALANFRRRPTSVTETEARTLLADLWHMRIAGYSGAAWGYNFAWQSRNFFAPQNTPMVVPTAFAARALLCAHETLADDQYLVMARSSCDFILKDLQRTVTAAGEVCFSYSPLDHTQIFNASLLAAETLAAVGRATGAAELQELALRAVRFVLDRQNADGSWHYGTGPGQDWIDNFHTGYVLLSLFRVMKCFPENEPEIGPGLRSGFQFWRERFFLADGWPKYYHDSLYPADAHAAATAIITLLELHELDPGALPLAEKIAGWTIRRLRSPQGYFYYQRRRFYSLSVPYMRWTQAWVLYAFGSLLEEHEKRKAGSQLTGAQEAH
jgi:hypothetical protein